MNRIISFIENKIMAALILAVCILFTLSIWEKMIADDAMSLGRAAVQALTLDAPEEGFTLYLRFVINVTLAWAVIRVYIASVGLSFDRLVASRLSRDHIVIIAEGDIIDYSALQIGRNHFYLAYDLALTTAVTSNVVFVAPSITDDKRMSLWNAGVKVLDYQKDLQKLLSQAGALRAKILVSMRSDLDENIAICRVALSSKYASQSLKVFCQIPTQGERRRFNPEFYFDSETLVRFRSFNESQMIARDLLQQFPPDAMTTPLDDAPIHIGLFGFGEIGQAIVEQLARIGHYRNGKKPIVSIFAKDLDSQWEFVLQELPAIVDWLDIRCYDCSEKSDFSIDNQCINTMTRAYICHVNEVINLRLSKALVDLQLGGLTDERSGFDIVAIDPLGGMILEDFWVTGNHNGRFQLYSLGSRRMTQVQIGSSLLTEDTDRRARSLHNAYVEKELAKLGAENSLPLASFVKPWDELPENIRDTNRRVADHFEVKVRAIGCILASVDCGDEIELTASELEILAIMEHRRWWADRALNGWKYGAKRQDAQKIHPNMVAYEVLSEADKQKDRDFVIEVIDIFRHEGMVIARDDRASVI
jgi:hypothetical protein